MNPSQIILNALGADTPEQPQAYPHASPQVEALAGWVVARSICMAAADWFGLSFDQARDCLVDAFCRLTLEQLGDLLDTPERWELVSELIALDARIDDAAPFPVTVH